MDNQQEKNAEARQEITVQDSSRTPAPAKGNIVKSAKEFFGNAFGNAKNQDIAGLVEEFTSEMTIVAEGLSEDQERVNGQVDLLSAHQSEMEETFRKKLREDEQKLNRLEKDLSVLSERVQKLEEAAARKKEKSSEKKTSLLKQATWLVGIIAAAWVITSIIGLFK